MAIQNGITFDDIKSCLSGKVLYYDIDGDVTRVTANVKQQDTPEPTVTAVKETPVDTNTSVPGLFDGATWHNGYWKITTGTASNAASTSYLTSNFMKIPSGDYSIKVKSVDGYVIGIRFYLCSSLSGTTANDVVKSGAYGSITGALSSGVDFSKIKSVSPSSGYFSVSIWVKSSTDGKVMKMSGKDYRDFITITRK